MIDIEIIGNQISNENAVNSNRSGSHNNTRSNATKVDEFQFKKSDSGCDNSLLNKSSENTTTTSKINKDNLGDNYSINDTQMNSMTDHTANNSVDIFNKKNFDDNNDKDIYYIQNQVKKLQKLLLSEQDKFTKLQKRLQDSETQRLEIISENNKEIFGLNSQCTKLRAELEKSEAIRQSIEYESSVSKTNLSKERSITSGKEKLCEEIQRNLEEKCNSLTNENSELKVKLQAIDGEYASELIKIKTSLDEKQMFLNKFQTEQDLFDKERLTLNTLVKDQDQHISQIKNELESQKETIKKMSSQIDNFKEKEEKLKKDNENLTNQLKTLEENQEKEKKVSLERKYNLEISQIKHKESMDQVRSYENMKIELELNISKLIEQLKENRKELSEEQKRNREMKERFKICETQFKTLNTDLTHKVEEKTNTIKSLAKQLTSYESNLNEIKYELNNTKARQGELDDVYNNCVKDIEYLINTFTSNDDYKFKQQNALKSNGSTNLFNSINSLKHTLEEYKRHSSQAYDQLRESRYTIDTFHSEYEKFKQIIDSKERLLKQCEEIKNKQENEMNVLRQERVALEEAINSLRVECETLKTSLNREYETNEANKKQLNKVSKSLKQIEEQKSNFLQALYKRLLPVLTSKTNSISNNGNEQNLESLIETAIISLISSIQKYNDNLNDIELKFKQKELQNEELKIKQDEQIKNLTKSLKEKETIFTKQKESLINYYEQLINDVNTRVKNTQPSVTEVWDRLKDTDNKAKHLDAECTNLKENVSKSQIQVRSLTTSCALLVGILVPLIKQNKELKEQRRIFEYLYKRLMQSQNQIIVLKDQNSFNYKTDQIKFMDSNIFSTNNDHAVDEFHNDDTENLSDLDNFDIFETDKNKKSKEQDQLKKKIVKLLNENDAACGNDMSKKSKKHHILEHLNENRIFSKHHLAMKLNNKPSKICLFRKATIVILAAHRLIYFHNYNSHTSLSVFDSIETRHKFIYSQSSTTSKFHVKKSDTKSNILKTILSNDIVENNIETKKLFSWLTSNNHILLLMDIGNELNRYLYGEESYTHNWDLDDNLSKTTKQCVLKCFNLLENMFAINSTISSNFTYLASKDEKTLCQRLKLGLNTWMNKDTRIAKYFSLDKKIQSLNEHLFELNQRYINTKMDHDLLKTQFQSFNNENNLIKSTKSKIKLLEEELGDLRKIQHQMVASDKFETVCKELELSLNREKQAEIMMNQQSVQLQDLSSKLAELSNTELNSFKLKEVNNTLKNEIDKKEKTIKSMSKKIQVLQKLSENLENSTCKFKIDKDVLMEYCQRVDNLIQKTLKPLVENCNFQEIMRIIKQIFNMDIFSQNIQDPNEDYYKPSAETVACHNMILVFCENYENLLKKVVEIENELFRLRNQLANMKDELKDALKPSDYKYTSLQSPSKFEQDYDISFHPLPNFSIHDNSLSAFKPLPSRIMHSSTPTSNNSSYHS